MAILGSSSFLSDFADKFPPAEDNVAPDAVAKEMTHMKTIIKAANNFISKSSKQMGMDAQMNYFNRIQFQRGFRLPSSLKKL